MSVDREGALAWLGLSPGATPEEVESVYRRHSRPLKRLLVQAKTLEERERYRGELRRVVQIRDRALGPEAARARRERRKAKKVDDWWTPEMDVPAGIRDRRAAAKFFGRGTPDAIRRVFHQRSRELKRRVAHAKDEKRIRAYQDSLKRLNELFRLALDVELTDSSFDLLVR